MPASTRRTVQVLEKEANQDERRCVSVSALHDAGAQAERPGDVLGMMVYPAAVASPER